NATGKQNAVIMADKVEVRLGVDKAGPLDVTQVKLPRGTLVEVVGPKLRDDTTTWYPITPPDGEYRWLPKEALGTASPLSPAPVFVKSGNPLPSADPGAKNPGNLTSFGGKLSDPAQHAQWNKAEQAERTGEYAQAEKLYTLIYQDLRQK